MVVRKDCDPVAGLYTVVAAQVVCDRADPRQMFAKADTLLRADDIFVVPVMNGVF